MEDIDRGPPGEAMIHGRSLCLGRLVFFFLSRSSCIYIASNQKPCHGKDTITR
jgi:hypothetical protein